MSDLSTLALDYLRKGMAPQANELALRAVKAMPKDWHARYALGQCFQYAGQWAQAAAEYASARQIKYGDKAILLALGIARQKERRYPDAVEALEEAVRIDPDFDLAFNSLGMTRKLAGDLAGAQMAYQSGIEAVVRHCVQAMRNGPDGPRFRFRLTRHGLWLDHARYGAEFLTKRDAILTPPVLPTPEDMERDARTGEFRAWFFEESRDPHGRPLRLFRPNYFNALFQDLAGRTNYLALLRNRAAAYQAMGDQAKAQAHQDEADDFA